MSNRANIVSTRSCATADPRGPGSTQPAQDQRDMENKQIEPALERVGHPELQVEYRAADGSDKLVMKRSAADARRVGTDRRANRKLIRAAPAVPALPLASLISP